MNKKIPLFIILFGFVPTRVDAEWIQVSDFPGTLLRSGNSVSFGGKGFIFGGNEWNGNFNNNVWMYDPSENIWVQKSNFPNSLNDSYI